MNRFDNNNEEFSEEDFMNVEIEDVHDDDEDDINEKYYTHQCANDYERKYPWKKNETFSEWLQRLANQELADLGCANLNEYKELMDKRYEQKQKEEARRNPPPPPPPTPTGPGFFEEFFGRCKDILTLKFLSEGSPMDPGTNPLNLAIGNRRTCCHCMMQIPNMARTCPFCKSIS